MMTNKSKSGTQANRKSLLSKSSVSTQPKAQKFNITVMPKQLSDNDQTVYKSTKSVSVSHEKNFFDQRLKNFHKVLTESIQRQPMIAKKQGPPKGKIDARQVFTKLFGDRDPKTHKSWINPRNLTPSPSTRVRPQSQLITQINSLLQSSNRLGFSPPSTSPKRMAGHVKLSLYSSSDVKLISNYGSVQKIQHNDDLQSRLEFLTKRVQQVLSNHYNEKMLWNQERETIQQKLFDVQMQIELRQNTVQDQSSYVFIEDPKEVLEIDLVPSSPMNFNDLSFG